MKQLTIILIALSISIAGASQKIVARRSAANTVMGVNYLPTTTYRIPSFEDTSKIDKLVDTCGSVIYIKKDSSLWVRKCYVGYKKWDNIKY